MTTRLHTDHAAVAAGVSFALGQGLEGISILAALVINVLIGFGTELRATRSMEALQQMTRMHAMVLRPLIKKALLFINNKSVIRAPD